MCLDPTVQFKNYSIRKFNLNKPKLGRKVKVKKRIDNEGMEQESS